ncbi:MAG: hypothetical protein CW716_04445 [Candidatus Bathyarchaeum sp.]|nr:MAG: hypothetical protein CW716_04445 [Candidatus Bathyarchaeum sp.]
MIKMRRASLLLVFVLLVAFTTPVVLSQPVTITVPDDFSTIQQAVDAASPGDTIFVRAGTYNEAVIVNTDSLQLVGENKLTTIIDRTGGNNQAAVTVNADNVTVSGFTVQNSYDGICLRGSSYSTVSGNIISVCSMRGILLVSSSFVTVSGNTLTNNFDGLELYDSSFVSVSGNTITNSRLSIGTSKSFSNTFSDNTITVSQIGVYVWDCSYTTASGNIITDTTEHSICVVLSDHCEFSANDITNSAMRGISIGNSSNCLVSENNVKFTTTQGIHSFYSSGITVSENTLTNNFVGFGFYTCSDSTAFGNTISQCRTGITVVNASNNKFYHNSLIANQYSISVQNCINLWDDGYPSGGNYWSNYYGEDADGDGIGDTPYIIFETDQDNYPLMFPYGSNLSDSCTLVVDSLPGGVTFTAQDEPHTTPWSETYNETTLVTLVMPETYVFGEKTYNWSQWSDGDTNRTRIVNVDEYTELTASFITEFVVPEVVLLSPENTTYTTTDVPLEYTTSTPIQVMTYSLDGQENVTFVGNTTLTDLTQGPHNIVIYNEYFPGNFTASDTVYFTVAPVSSGFTLLSPENTTYTTADVPLIYIKNETCYVTYFELDGEGNYTEPGNTTLVGLVDGVHQLLMCVNYTDSFFGENVSVVFTVNKTVPDTTPPAVTVLSPTNTTYTSNDVPLDFTVDEPTDWICYSLDGQSNITINGNTTLTGLTEGQHFLVVYANDTSGNTGASNTKYFTVELPILGVTIVLPENRTYATSEVPFSYLVNETATSVVYSLDGQPPVDAENVTVLSGLGDGLHELMVVANFTGSETSESATVWFTVDTISPDISGVTVLPLTVNGSFEEGAKVNATVTDTTSGVDQVTLNYTIDNQTWTTTEMANLEANIWNCTLPGFPHATNVTYNIIAKDMAGNTITTEELYGQPSQYQVLPEFVSWIILPILLSFTLLGTVYKKKLRKKRNQQSY